MNGTLFGMGLSEMIAIAVLTLLVFGPERLPGLMRNFGRGVRKMREIYTTLAAEVQKELGPYAQEIDAVTRDLRQDINSIREITDVRNLIPPISLTAADEPKAAAPLPENANTIGGVMMAPVNETPMSFPPFDPKPAAPDAAAAETAPGPVAGEAVGSANPSAPSVEEQVSPGATSSSAVTLSDDNPWKS